VKRRRVGIISVVPSPYQRDLFAALASRSEIDLSVYYMEAASPDSPWPERPLATYEQILPGFWFPFRGRACALQLGPAADAELRCRRSEFAHVDHLAAAHARPLAIHPVDLHGREAGQARCAMA
jgi:hypothetical protein